MKLNYQEEIREFLGENWNNNVQVEFVRICQMFVVGLLYDNEAIQQEEYSELEILDILKHNSIFTINVWSIDEDGVIASGEWIECDFSELVNIIRSLPSLLIGLN